MRTSFDIIGNIAILPLFTENSWKLARKIMAGNKNIKSVYMKIGKIKGRLRRNHLKFVAGEKNLETIHRESGCKFKLDVEKCYFSPRLSNERIDICKQVKKGERVLVMFSGVGPFSIVIAKNSRAGEVYGVELNKIAAKYAQENITLNRLKNCFAIQGDVKKIVPKLKMKFDRIVMARPQLKDDFLDCALKASKKNSLIHFYDFLHEEEMPEAALEKIKSGCKKAKKKFKIIGWKKALEIGPRKWRVRVDFKIL
jgi:tRNA (guanine37-N1)-methyltransferase